MTATPHSHTVSSAPGTSRTASAFAAARTSEQPAVLPFVTAGFPSLAVTRALLPRLSAAGAAVIEVGIPFSDPIADGPVIAESMHEALLAGCTPEKVFEMIRQVRQEVTAALIAMVSVSIVSRMGFERFVREAADAGFDGIIVPDLDIEDAPQLRAACDAAGLTLTLLVSPTSSDARIRAITAACSGFVYALARVGITGERADAPDIRPLIQRIRATTALPIAAGFGISTAEHVQAVTQHADGAIVGSALVRRMNEAKLAGLSEVEAAVSLLKLLIEVKH